MTQSAEPKSAKHEPLDAAALERIFLAGRTHNAWQNKPVAPALLTQIYDLMKNGPDQRKLLSSAAGFRCLAGRQGEAVAASYGR